MGVIEVFCGEDVASWLSELQGSMLFIVYIVIHIFCPCGT